MRAWLTKPILRGVRHSSLNARLPAFPTYIGVCPPFGPRAVMTMDRSWDRALIAFMADTKPEDAPYKVSEVSERMANNILPKLNLSKTK